MTEHLYRLRRISRCCGERVAHSRKFPDLGLVCADCGEEVRDFLIENAWGAVVWPPSPAAVRRIPRCRPLPRNRRKIREADPRGYRVILPGSRG
jgi:hypothetical protein